MANIDKGVHEIKSLEEKKGTMNSEYFGSNKGICTILIRGGIK